MFLALMGFMVWWGNKDIYNKGGKQKYIRVYNINGVKETTVKQIEDQGTDRPVFIRWPGKASRRRWPWS